MLNVVILAAGMGKRMQSNLPKVLHTLAGRPMLAHVLESARALDPARIVVVVGHGAERVQAFFSDATDIQFVEQKPQLGTGHAVQQAEPLLLGGEGAQDFTLVLYGDVPLVRPESLRGVMSASAGGLALLTENLEDATGYGRIVRGADGAVERIVEHKDANDAELAITEVNTGIVCASTESLKTWLGKLSNDNAQQEYYLTDIVSLAVADGVKVGAAQAGAPWETMGVNSRVQQAQLERTYQNEQARRQMEAGVTLADPSRFDVRGSLHCGRDVYIDVGCVFEGDVVLADGVRIGPHCVLQNVELGERAQVHAFSHLSGARTDHDVVIGPYARLRPGADLGPKSHVGNFVEIKNTKLGAESKANHLTYLGDAEIGTRVNVGAGTITCNYDGVNKHRTVIEDDVFIGSGTELVAPITVRRGATLGAGTTLTQEAESDKLTLARARQVTIEGWQRPAKTS